jgi:hypothetical protein
MNSLLVTNNEFTRQKTGVKKMETLTLSFGKKGTENSFFTETEDSHCDTSL